MKRIIISLFFISITLSTFAQGNSEVQTAYNQVANTLKNYEIKPESMSSDVYQIQSMGIIYRHPNIEISFNFALKENIWSIGNDVSGNYKLIVPINSTTFETQNIYGECALNIKNQNGIDLVYKGKHQLLEKYYFSGTALTMKKLCSELSDLQRLIQTTHYSGNLGVSKTSVATPTKTSTSSTNSLTKTFENKDFSLKYPDSWEIVQNGNGKVAVQIMEIQKNDYDFLPNINVVIISEKKTESATTLTDITISQNKSLTATYKLLNRNDSVTLSQCQGCRIEQQYFLQGYNLRCIQYIVKKKDNTVFVITATIDANKYPLQLALINQIIKTLIIK